jgi:hypothetical protein
VSYDNLVNAKLRNPAFVRVADALLQRYYHILCVKNETKIKITGRIDVKCLLGAYLIAFKPEYVFEVATDKSKAVQEASLPMLNSFLHVTNAIVETAKFFHELSPTITPQFASAFATYFIRFKQWKTEVLTMLYL